MACSFPSFPSPHIGACALPREHGDDGPVLHRHGRVVDRRTAGLLGRGGRCRVSGAAGIDPAAPGNHAPSGQHAPRRGPTRKPAPSLPDRTGVDQPHDPPAVAQPAQPDIADPPRSGVRGHGQHRLAQHGLGEPFPLGFQGRPCRTGDLMRAPDLEALSLPARHGLSRQRVAMPTAVDQDRLDDRATARPPHTHVPDMAQMLTTRPTHRGTHHAAQPQHRRSRGSPPYQPHALHTLFPMPRRERSAHLAIQTRLRAGGYPLPTQKQFSKTIPELRDFPTRAPREPLISTVSAKIYTLVHSGTYLPREPA